MEKLTYTIRVPALFCKSAVWLLLLYRRLRYGYSFRRIKLTQGQYAKVDAEFYEKLNKYRWYAHKNKGTYYAYRAAQVWEGREQRNVKMHHEVVKLNTKTGILTRNIGTKQIQNYKDKKSKLIVDHINGDGCDNRSANLRLASYSQNSYNRGKIRRMCGSKYKGVWRNKKTGRWRAQICFKGEKKHLGYYADEASAARAYDAAAVRYHGEFARLNFPSTKT